MSLRPKRKTKGVKAVGSGAVLGITAPTLTVSGEMEAAGAWMRGISAIAMRGTNLRARARWEDTKMPKKHKTLRQEMDEALLSHGPAHFIALKWFEKQARLKRAKRKRHNAGAGAPATKDL